MGVQVLKKYDEKINTQNLKKNLAFIKTHFSIILNINKKLETRSPYIMEV